MNLQRRISTFAPILLLLGLCCCGQADENSYEPGVVGPNGEMGPAMTNAPGDNTNPTSPAAPTTPPTNAPGETTDPVPTEPTDPDPMMPTEPGMETACGEGEERVDGACVPARVEGEIDPAIIERISGIYAVQMTVAMVQSVPLLGDLDSISTVFAFIEIMEDASGDLVMVETGCGARSSTGNAINVVIPEAIPRSVEATNSPITVWEESGVIQWSRPTGVVPIGIRLADPMNDELPTNPNDPRIWDQDDDGNPGVTVNVSGFASGDLYIIQKQISSWRGTLDNQGELSGLITDNSTQVTIGSSNPLLNQQIPSRPHPDPNLSVLRTVRMDGQSDCEWLMENEAELFRGTR